MVFLKSRKLKELEERIGALEYLLKYRTPSYEEVGQIENKVFSLCDFLNIEQLKEPAKLVTKYKERDE